MSDSTNMAKDRAILTMALWQTNNKSFMIYQMVPFFNDLDLNDPLPRFQAHAIFQRNR